MVDSSSDETGQLIYQAVYYNNEELLRDLISVNADKVNYKDINGKNSLHIAVQHKNLTTVDLLINSGIDVNCIAGKNVNCVSPLHIAAADGSTSIVRRLIEAGAELFSADHNDHYALELAQMYNHFDTACVLIDAIELERIRNRDLHDLLINACISGEVDDAVVVLSKVTSANADVILNGATYDGKCSLYIACLNGHTIIVDELLQLRDHVLIQPVTHDTVLHAAISSQQSPVVNMILVDFAHLITVKNADDSNALHWASQCGNMDVIKTLMEFPYAEDMIARIEDVTGRFSYNFVFDVNALDSHCRTALYLAVGNSHIDVVNYFLETVFPTMSCKRRCPFQIDVYCSGGRTPLMVAAANGSIEIVRLLLHHGADVNLPCGLTDADISSLDGARCIGSGALNEACRIGSLPLVQLLLQRGAVDYDNIALATANKHKHDVIVRLFLIRLAFPDPDYRVNRKGFDFGQLALGRHLMPMTVFPATSCMLNWHNTNLLTLNVDWLTFACLQLNQRLRTSRYALFALTRIDISLNQLEILPAAIFLLHSLRSLNASKNKISEIVLPDDNWVTPLLENLSLEQNEIESLPNCIFSSHLPSLSCLDVSFNKLSTLPETLWMAPKLVELNVSNNSISALPMTATFSYPSSRIFVNSNVENLLPEAGTNNSTDDSNSIGGRIDDTNITFHELKRHNLWQTNISLAHSDDSDADSASEQSLSTLTSLNLSYNSLFVLPSCLTCCCPRLARLNISNNRLQSLGPVECFPISLRHLDASENELVVAFEGIHPTSLVCHAAQQTNTAARSLRQNSPIRKSRSRSKSAVRSQRSLSVTRASESVNEIHIDACVHKQHTRLEALQTLQLSKNKLTELPLFVLESKTMNLKSRNRENCRDLFRLRHHVLFPSLVTLDISNNVLKVIPDAICCLSSLSTFNLSGNVGIETLPPELGLLGKLWHLNLNGCGLRDPIKNLVRTENYKTVDLIAYLKSILEDSRQYARLKLMIVGVQGIGKTSLLQQIRLEGVVKKTTCNDTWSKRVGKSPGNSDRTNKGVNMSTVGVDIGEWTYEPKKNKHDQTYGPVTFRTWDFGGQREYYATHQYFLSRRSIYIVVWKVTDGEAAIPDINQWLINIQARAANSPVIIVGTHVDQVLLNINRLSTNYLEDLDMQIRDRFIVVADADKKGLPRVVDSLFVSSKTRQNIRTLCNLMYKVAFDIRTTGGKERLLEQKVPASYLAFEKIAAEISDERRVSGLEPVMRSHDYFTVVQEKMLKNYGRCFRDSIEFNHACSFLHENGVILHYEDVTLRELYFLDPQWLCDLLAHIITIREINPFAKSGLMKIDDLQILFKSVKTSDSNLNLRTHIVSLLHKFEVALTWQSRSLLIPSLLPDEYQLRAGYPGSRVTVPVKMNSWQLNCTGVTGCNVLFEDSVFGPFKVAKSDNMHATLYDECSDDITFRSRASHASINEREDLSSDGCEAETVSFDSSKENSEFIRRVYVMAYIPSGFWSRLMTRILVDDHITCCIEQLFNVQHLSFNNSIDTLKHICNKKFRPKWLLWQTGIEVIAFGRSIFALRQFLPLANVNDVHYESVEWQVTGEDGLWRDLNVNGSSLIEIIFPLIRVEITESLKKYSIFTNHVAVTRFLALITDLIDTLLEDWYPALGTRFVHTSEGKLLVNRLIPCPYCAKQCSECCGIQCGQEISNNSSENCDQRNQPEVNLLSSNNKPNVVKSRKLFAYSVEECILFAHDGIDPVCPNHSNLSVSSIAPDTAFIDLSTNFIIPSSAIKRGKMIGHGAFGFVFKATVKKDYSVHDAALKMLEPVEPGMGARTTSISAYKASKAKWERDPLQNACRAYCICRQELNVLASLQHSNINSLIGLCSQPLALIVELAPLGDLNNLLQNYKRSGARLHLSVIQDTVSQVAKALEYLHEHHIIYRDLKCHNILTWRFPPPFSSITDVLVKLGDYGISRCSFPSGGAKGFGGTEGFMAPEIMMYNGEQEYTEKVDCFSFAMFLYELISFKLPFNCQDQVKEYIIDGGRPRLTPAELLFPCNVLDVMVVCWAARPMDRPSASQIVSMTTAPEFTHLLDVISLNDSDSTVHASQSFAMVDENELYHGFDDSMEGEVWLSRSDGSITVLGCNQYGWLDSKSISVGGDGSVITAMCAVLDSVWLAESTGLIRIFCRNSYTELYCFSIARFLPSAHLSISVISMFTFSLSPVTVLLTLPSSLLLVNGEKSLDNSLIAAVDTSIIYSSAIIDFANSRQIWIGHCDTSISIFHVSPNNTISFSSLLRHEDGNSESSASCTVSYLLSCATDQSFIWSSVTPGGKVYQWSVSERKVVSRLDIRKILPSSESISTLDIEFSQNDDVTALSILDRTDGAQLFIGTSKGVVIVAQAIQMRPLAACRPYLEDVHSIITLDSSNTILDFLKPRRDTNHTSLNSMHMRSNSGQNSYNTGSDFMETVNWMKDQVSETVNRLRTSSSDYQTNFCSYVITIGSGYRCLIDRFTDRKHQNLAQLRSKSQCAMIWRTDDWIL